ncbi:MAG: DJ-1/PfpI family protein [candidate division Zixibacteria bacterium]|nr:DJ-1/PfpI family protein [candidate division Zixibacteria bacterium]
MEKTALLVMADGFEDIEAVAPIDVLTRAGVKVTIAALRPGAVHAAYGTTVMPHKTVDQITGLFDAIIFPGGRMNAESLAHSDKVIELAKQHFQAKKIVAAICAAPSHVLGEGAGLLRGKRATGDPGFNDRLAAAGAKVTNQKVTVDGNLITGMGPGAAMEFALMLAEKLVSKEVADQFAAKWQIAR